MLAADAASAATATEDVSAIGSVPQSEVGSAREIGSALPTWAESSVQLRVSEIAFIDGEIENIQELIDVTRSDIEVVLIDPARDVIQQMSQILSERQDVQAVHVVSHGAAGELQMAGQTINAQRLHASAEHFESWQRALADNADVIVYGCDVANGTLGKDFIRTFADMTGADVAASTDRTGIRSSARDERAAGDWEMEFSVGSVDTRLLASTNQLMRADVSLPISIRAAGATGNEEMQLLVDGVAVQTWNNVGGDADSGQFQTFTYDGVSNISADRVRVAFTNDVYEPAQNIDYNLRVDSITIDGTVFETENPNVFGTGTWKPADGITPGFRESEWLAANGYFQYSDLGATPGGGNGSQIEVFAAGNENDETMQLWIDGSLAKTWNDIGGNADARQFERYVFNASATVQAKDVQIFFTNDRYENDGEIDRNLRVDRIVVDGASFETESPTVFSTGTWQNGGVTPGFVQDETLHINGSFQFDAAAVSPGVIALESSNVTVDEDAGSVRLSVVRSQGTDGAVTVDYATQPGSATEGDDFTAQSGTLTFEDGETRQDIVIPILDNNVAESIEQFNVTIDNVVGGATLLVPRTATVTINDDETPLPSFADFSSVAGLELNGNARRVGDQLELTQDARNQAGSAFFETTIDLEQDGSFRSAFSFVGGGDPGGADGLTFTIQNDSRGASALGATGGSLGYDGIAQSVAVEFDTYKNGSIDVNNNHVSILQGNVANAIQTRVADLDFNSGDPIFAWVDYNGTSNSLAVYVSDDATKPTLALVKADVDLESIVGDSAFVGFTAGTGGLANTHRVRNWTLDQQNPPQNPPTEVGDTVTEVDVVT
ncbi:MAG: DUF4347 domain-containing protein, partial [Planctomycetota bacterium]